MSKHFIKAFILMGIVIQTMTHSTLMAQRSPKLVVAQDGSGNYKTIQEAINHFQNMSDKYGKIYIKAGTYNEKLWIDSTKHHLLLEGENAQKVIITYTLARDVWRCSNPDDYGAATINVKGHDLVFKNLTVINDYGYKAEKDVTIDCLNESGKVNNSTVQRYALPREAGEQEGKKIVRKDGHQFAFRSMPGATRLSFESCVFRSGGGDTVSPWDVDNGVYYFKDCIIEGHVDLYCPRGYALAENCLFICHNMNAAIWHDGSADQNAKTVLKNCKFVGDKGYKLGRYHREAQIYLFNCSFDSNMADAPIYQSGDRKLKWGHRVYYKNCHREGGDYQWHKDNTGISPKTVNKKWVFGNKVF
jgi:pectin methylesterase-like acyl-CoA thioesterase